MSARGGTMARHALPLLALLVGSLLAGCVSTMTDVKSLSGLTSSDVILVGRLELDPPLKPEEQNINVVGPYDKTNHFFFFLNDTVQPVADTPIETHYDAMLYEPFNETFYVVQKPRPAFFTAGFTYLSWGTRDGTERAWFPGGWKVEIKPGDRAVYMGTIRYTRNEFFDIKKVQLIDEYAKEKREFEKRFGTSVKLMKRLAMAEKEPKK